MAEEECHVAGQIHFEEAQRLIVCAANEANKFSDEAAKQISAQSFVSPAMQEAIDNLPQVEKSLKLARELGERIDILNGAPDDKEAAAFRLLTEHVKDHPLQVAASMLGVIKAPRKTKRIKDERGRPKGGGYKKSDRKLLLEFKNEHGSLPQQKELWALAPSAGGTDSKDPYDRSSTIKRLERAVRALRKEGF